MREATQSSVYICGPMTGIAENNFPAFDAAEEFLRGEGWEVINPAEATRRYWRAVYGMEFSPGQAIDNGQYRGLLASDIDHIAGCDAVAVLDGWEQSPGARAEVAYAEACGIEILSAATGKPLCEECEGDPCPLAEASKVVNGDRQHHYGHPIDNHGCTAEMWRSLLSRQFGVDIPLTAETVCELMIAQKLSRQANRPKHDNIVDICGYAANIHMIQQERLQRQEVVLNG